MHWSIFDFVALMSWAPIWRNVLPDSLRKPLHIVTRRVEAAGQGISACLCMFPCRSDYIFTHMGCGVHSLYTFPDDSSGLGSVLAWALGRYLKQGFTMHKNLRISICL